MKPKIILITVSLALLLSSCAPAQPTPTAAPTSIPPTETPLPTATSTPEPTATSTLEPTPTALPSISTDTAKQVLSKLVAENGGCMLPCLLGLSPITSDRAAVENFVRYFQERSTPVEQRVGVMDIFENKVGERVEIDGFQYGVLFYFWDSQISVYVGLGIELKNDSIGYMSFSTEVHENYADRAVILTNHPDFDALLGHFSLSRILSDYGKPTEIWIYPFPEDIPDHTYANASYPFDFVLVFLEKGFAVEYMAIVKESEGYLIGCPNTSYMKIASWNPEREINFTEIADFFDGTDSLSVSNSPFFKQIQDVTSLSVDDFYEHFRNPDSGECVKTPRDLWP